MHAYLVSDHSRMLRLTERSLRDVLEFCAARECMSAETLEYCTSCTMFKCFAKTEQGRDVAAVTDEHEVDELWRIAQRVLKES